MPRIEIEIRGERIITVDEVINVVVDVPQDILDGDNPDYGLQDWVETQLAIAGSPLSEAANDDVNVTVEDETTDFEISEVHDLGPHD